MGRGVVVGAAMRRRRWRDGTGRTGRDGGGSWGVEHGETGHGRGEGGVVGERGLRSRGGCVGNRARCCAGVVSQEVLAEPYCAGTRCKEKGM